MQKRIQTGAREWAERGRVLMLRVTTLHASSASATARYYAQYLTAAPGEEPGVWCGGQAGGLGLSGTVHAEALELLLSGRDPVSGTRLGRELVDRYTSDGRLVRAVSGFDATFSAPKSLSVWWALTGDVRLLEAHDVAVATALTHLERFGSTTRIRRDGGRLHPDTQGLTMATFRQTTSRADDPQIHTHAVVSAKVQTVEGRWLALDARYLKRHQRMLGGLYQSVLRNELTHRFGVDWAPIEKGQAEIAGVPAELLTMFSKRTAAIDVALAVKVDDFRRRQGREPSRFERAAMGREAAVDTRARKSGHGAPGLVTRWRREAAAAGWNVDQVLDGIVQAGRDAGQAVAGVTVAEVLDAVSAQHSAWGRADVVQAICDRQRPVSRFTGRGWGDAVERAADHVLAQCVELDPPEPALRRRSDRRSVWLEPTAAHYTTEPVLTQEEHIVSWVLDAHAQPPEPSSTVEADGLDVLQSAAAAAVAGHDRAVLVVGPAGAGKTRMLAAAATDLHRHGRRVFGVAPTAKAARVLERDTGIPADTVAKLLHEWSRTDRPPAPEYRLPPGATVVVDEAGMLSTPALDRLVTLAERHEWRLVLVGDHRQLQAVGRGGLFTELCTTGRVEQLDQLHRFSHDWEAAASLRLRSGDRRAFDAYEAHGRIVAGTLDEHLERIAAVWMQRHRWGEKVALVASTNEHVDAINRAVQTARLDARHFNPHNKVRVGGGERAHIGDVVVTRRNDRRLTTEVGEPVRNRDTWTVTDVALDGSVTVTHRGGHGSVVLPVDYVGEHLRLGYAATEHGHQGDTVTAGVCLASPATTRRGLYVAATRGRDDNLICVITDSDDIAEARDILDGIVAVDRADIPAVTQRRTLATTDRPPPPPQDPPAPRRLTPRCAIPDWFHVLRDEITVALHQAAADVAAVAEQRRRRQARTVELQQQRTAAAAAYKPHDDAIQQARGAHQVAQSRHRHACQHLDDAGLRHRRDARRRLAVAEDRLTAATHTLRAVETAAEPHQRRLTDSVTELRQHEDDSRTIDQLDRWADRHGRHHQLHSINTALDTWQQWATGNHVTTTRLTQTAQTFESDTSVLHAPSYRALAQAIRNLTISNGIDLGVSEPPLRPPVTSRHELSIGLSR